MVKQLFLSCESKLSKLPMHSFLVMHKGELLIEKYYTPYDKNDLHRMFSITKSFCSLAILRLISQNKISLQSHICDFFPEYCDKNTSKWLLDMTIYDMLTMQTCHSSTTYKLSPNMDSVESFFKTQPSHRSGTIFMYDTSSSHTLAALVKKLTGYNVLDYLRKEFLNEIGFSKDAYIIKDEFGNEMGGSGLMARPTDLLNVGKWLLNEIANSQDTYAEYLKSAVSFHVSTVYATQTIDEQQGYGYQFWRVRNNGFAMYGMGGQYLLIYPEKDIIIVTTADLQNIKGGTQILLDEIYNTVSQIDKHTYNDLKKDICPISFNQDFNFYPNEQGFIKAKLYQNEHGGTFILSHKHNDFTFKYKFNESTLYKIQNYRVYTTAYPISQNLIYLKTEICDEYVGTMHIVLQYSKNNLSVWLKKVEETLFNEFYGFLEAEI